MCSGCRLLGKRVFGGLEILAGGPVILRVGAVAFGDDVERLAIQGSGICECAVHETYLCRSSQRGSIMRAVGQIAFIVDCQRMLSVVVGLVK